MVVELSSWKSVGYTPHPQYSPLSQLRRVSYYTNNSTFMNTITISVPTKYGTAPVTFEKLHFMPNRNIWILLAQDKIVIGTESPSKQWSISEPIDDYPNAFINLNSV